MSEHALPEPPALTEQAFYKRLIAPRAELTLRPPLRPAASGTWLGFGAFLYVNQSPLHWKTLYKAGQKQRLHEARPRARMEMIVSDCIHCDIHDLLEPELAREGADLGQIASKVTEVLADLVLSAGPEDRASLLADIIANLGHFVLEKGDQPEMSDEPKARRH